MERKVAFIGHRAFLPSDIEQRVRDAILNEIDLGCHDFVVGTYGDFDKIALNVCEELAKQNHNIKYTVVIISLNKINPVIVADEFGVHKDYPYEGMDTIMYDIENYHFKRRIIESNRRMIDKCDTLICYVNKNRARSGAMRTLKYAIRKKLKIVNLYKEGEF